ncbi:MAG TPA: Cof-type HAD-IIB family hydrolase [Bacillus bacterium]|uniref:Cof-type HAD-IIB family hydrolase n=1 Tax=Siminovitchia fordii TaxID=254759 RepID=UPI0003767259|nr:Cof-type HAD-IIB family hydrolase [Siminovitchia fordii]HBZ10100.1 Cof-type HAD-IIB family hydrolase [Bacillus sp. (in: firmicutes)]
MTYKMLVLNIDGTLLQDNGRIHKQTREAIEFALQKGIHIILATTRNFPAAKRTAKSLKLKDYIIAHQGAFIAKDINKPVYVQRVHERVASEITAFLESFPCQIRLVNEKFLISNKVKLPTNMMTRVVFQSANRFVYQERYVDSISEKLLDQPVSPPNFEVVFFDEKEMADSMMAIKEMYDEVVCIPIEPLKMVIVPAGVSKLEGVKFVCSQYGIKKHEVVSIGAGLDDLPLMQWSGLGVAMGNAPKEVHDAADWITRTNNENGVAYMVKEHFRKQYRLGFLNNLKRTDLIEEGPEKHFMMNIEKNNFK